MQATHGNFTTIGYSHPGIWPIMMYVLLVGAAPSVIAARAVRRSWKVISVTFAYRIDPGPVAAVGDPNATNLR